MLFKHIRWRIAVPYVLLVSASVLILALFFSGLLQQRYRADLREKLLSQALLLSGVLSADMAQGQSTAELQATASYYGALLGARVTVVAPDGQVLADSEAEPASMDNHLSRLEVQQALREGQGSATRLSDTLAQEMLYAAHVILGPEGDVVGVARLAISLDNVQHELARLRGSVLLATLIVAVLAWLLSLAIAERTARPVRWLTTVVERVSQGDLNARLVPTTRDEMGQLTRAFNVMADRLRTTISTLSGEQRRWAAVLEHMADGVLIVDSEGAVQLLNPAAARLLLADAQAVVGRSLAQVARHYEIITLWQQCRSEGREQVALVELEREGPALQVIVTPLEAKESPSCLLILQDLTHVRRLETVRRDFISNISHELRTPLASLKALAETLRDGALEDPAAARRFLDRIDTEVDVLVQMVRELLELSRIESGQVPVRLEAVSLAEVVLPPVERLMPQAERAGLDLGVDLPTQPPLVLADIERIQQVVTNLVHNAIKFTPAGGRVALSARVVGREVIVSVADTGIGIAAEDLSRIFERFYKADRARSGGGTGLGLAIAKHLVRAHQGRIWAESVEGRGSTFYFTLAVAERPPAQQISTRITR